MGIPYPSEEFLETAREEVEADARHRYLSDVRDFSNDETTPGETFTSLYEVFTCLEDEAIAHRPEKEMLYDFWVQCLYRFPSKIPGEEVPLGGATERYTIAAQQMLGEVMETISIQRPEEARQWLENELRHRDVVGLPDEVTIKDKLKDIDPFSMNSDELSLFVLDLFMEYDDDQNGTLDRKEFKKVLESSALSLKKKDIYRIMAECDENDDGVIEYKEFMPLMVDIIHNMKAQEEAAAARAAEDADAEQEAQYMLHGMTEAELTEVFESVFKEADADGSGALDYKEFKKCLKNSKLSLSKKEINLLLSMCDQDGDGQITYEEFVPMCYSMLLEHFKQQTLANKALQSADYLQEMLLEGFQNKEIEVNTEKGIPEDEYDGFLKLKKVKEVLEDISYETLGLSKMQILSLMGECHADHKDRVNYKLYAPVCSTMIYTMIDFKTQKKRMAAIEEFSRTSAADMLRDLDAESVKGILKDAFKAVDTDNSGTLDHDELRDILEAMDEKIKLSMSEVDAIMAAVDTDESGHVQYDELLDFIFDLLVHLEREHYVQKEAFTRSTASISEAQTGTKRADDLGGQEFIQHKMGVEA